MRYHEFSGKDPLQTSGFKETFPPTKAERLPRWQGITRFLDRDAGQSDNCSRQPCDVPGLLS